MTATSMADQSAVGDALDLAALRPIHLVIVAVCAVAFALDLGESAFSNVLASIISGAPAGRWDTGLLPWFLSSVYIGAIIGAPLLGWTADHFGRRIVMSLTLLVLALSSAGGAISSDLLTMIFARFFSGVALGAYPALMAAYLTDVLPARNRGALNMIAVAGGYIGAPATTFLTRALQPIDPFGIEGWRVVLGIGALGSIAAAALFTLLPESPRWLEAKGRVEQAKAGLLVFAPKAATAQAIAAAPAFRATSGVLNAKEYRRRLTLILLLSFLTPWATTTFHSLSGTILIHKGVNVQDSLLYTGVGNFGPIVGLVLAGLLVSAVPRKWSLAGSASLLIIFGLAFAVASTPIQMMTSAMAFSLTSSILTPILVLYSAELFPTHQRAISASWAWSSSRVASALVPLVMLPLLKQTGAVPVFVIAGGVLMVFVFVVWTFAPQRSTD